MRVIVTYARLLLFPINQNLIYDYPLSHSFWEPRVIVSMVFIALALGLAVYLLGGSGRLATRLAAFGVFWFFLALSVESTLIPLQAINEHRMYLPGVGAFVAITTAVFMIPALAEKRKYRVPGIVLFAIISIMLSSATLARNTIWESKFDLWTDVVRKAPGNHRGHLNLGVAYKDRGESDRAMEHYQTAVRLRPDSEEAYFNIGNAYKDRGEIDRAIWHYREAIRLKPTHAMAHSNLGIVYALKGESDRAIEHYRKAITIEPDFAEAYFNLGNAYRNKGAISRAIEHYRKAITADPDFAEADYNLGNIHRDREQYGKAIGYYKAAISKNQDHAWAHNNLGVAYMLKGMPDKAAEQYEKALSLMPGNRTVLSNLQRLQRQEQKATD
jgi:tetratricopeptide (TPR) repeat protein